MDQERSFDSALCYLPTRLQPRLRSLPAKEKAAIREFRLRADQPLCLVHENGIRFLAEDGLHRLWSKQAEMIEKKELDEVFHRLCAYSVYSCKEAINRGFLPIPGGHRAGIAGTAVAESGKITAVREISSVALRIAREIPGAADSVFPYTAAGTKSILVAGPPGSGKTTVLRDLTRQLAGWERGCFRRVVICDERGELAAVKDGVPQTDVGISCDVLTGYPKSDAVEIAMRSFSPDYIICDEIATAREAEAITVGMRSGVHFALSIHADRSTDLRKKPLLHQLLQAEDFSAILLLSTDPVGQVSEVIRPEALLD